MTELELLKRENEELRAKGNSMFVCLAIMIAFSYVLTGMFITMNTERMQLQHKLREIEDRHDQL